MVVQLAFDDGAAIVDPLAIADLRPLVAALAKRRSSDTRSRVGPQDLRRSLRVVPANVFDTQVAAAFLGYGMQISLADLVRDVQHVRFGEIADGQRLVGASVLANGRLEYLVDDVAHLLPMYDALRERLGAHRAGTSGRSRSARSSAISTRYRIDERRAYLRIPGAMRMSRRELGILNELVKLRDRIARERDVPLQVHAARRRRRGLATLRPKRIDDLAQLRRLDAGTRRQLGAAILEAVARGEALDERAFRRGRSAPAAPARDTLVSAARRGRRRDRPRGGSPAESARAAGGARTRRARGAARSRASKPARVAAVALELVGRAAVAAALGRGGLDDRRLRGRRSRKYVCPMTSHANSFDALDTLRVGDRSYAYFRLDALERAGIAKLARLPFSLKILLENLLRFEDGRSVTEDATSKRSRAGRATARHEKEIAFRPARVLLARFHRRSVRRRSGGDARCDGRDGRRSQGDQSAAAGRARHRSLGASRLLRFERRAGEERRSRVRAQPRALRVS